LPAAAGQGVAPGDAVTVSWAVDATLVYADA